MIRPAGSEPIRVYVSCTHDDLKEHRAAAAQALRRVDRKSVAMEDYSMVIAR